MSTSLATVKAEIKAWERAFRVKHDRNPAREDIKARRDIADKYTLYKKLVKAAGEGGAEPPAGTGNGKGSTNKSKPAVDVDRSEQAHQADESNTTSLQPDSLLHTPRKNKTSDRWRRPPAEEAGNTNGNQQLLGLPQVTTADNPFLSPARKQRPTPTQTSLGRNKVYPPPISDPAHRNPFESDVVPGHEIDTSRDKTEETAAVVTQSPSKQAFLFAPSPKRLKSLLQVNSLHAAATSSSTRSFTSPGKGSTSSIPAITPRTRARKRLRGEEVDDTPEKEREREGKSLKIGSRWAQARSLRMQRGGQVVPDGGTAQSVVPGNNVQNVGRINVWKRDVQDEAMPHVDAIGGQRGMGQSEDDDDDDDEIFGPTPVKAPANASFSGTATGKRLFLDILPPLEETVPIPPAVSVPLQPYQELSAATRETQQDLDMQDAGDTVGRTPSKAMSRFLALKPRSLTSPRVLEDGSAMDVQLDSAALEGRSAMDVKSVGMGSGASGSGDEDDDRYDEDDEDMIRPEAIDIDAFGQGLEEEQAQDGNDASQNALVREISLSDEEDGGTDGIDDDAEMEGNRGSTARAGGRRLRIESYRYTLQQKVAQQRLEKKSNLFSDEEMDEVDRDNGLYTADDHATTQPEPFQALSKLSIQSPETKVVLKTMALQQARAKAIFDGRARAQLRAAKRAPVYGAGEGMGNRYAEDEGGDGGAVAAAAMGGQGMVVNPFVDEGDDDDWESEAEGWKATGLPDDDDW
ncbi:hypothetical protein QFC22_004023 [Naganishia vaughanmartiniae]|uniref:Uncharacterized protein n=1 Tax=Naganishia vaughanmartiniae TaxID=1424756 RepID=A0ACC2X490_9TREE|nr:hypothetical protein QFC22_004023 [Naganishia vaughanmartiniae]